MNHDRYFCKEWRANIAIEFTYSTVILGYSIFLYQKTFPVTAAAGTVKIIINILVNS